jgi:hypothetical protein
MKEDVSMKIRLQIAALLAAFALTSGYAYAESSPNLSHAELKKMVRAAHTADDYASLASYFRWRQEEFKEQARGELENWYRYYRFSAVTEGKYPRPADYSRIRYEYYRNEAQQMSQKAAHYENLAETAQH